MTKLSTKQGHLWRKQLVLSDQVVLLFMLCHVMSLSFLTTEQCLPYVTLLTTISTPKQVWKSASVSRALPLCRADHSLLLTRPRTADLTRARAGSSAPYYCCASCGACRHNRQRAGCTFHASRSSRWHPTQPRRPFGACANGAMRRSEITEQGCGFPDSGTVLVAARSGRT